MLISKVLRRVLEKRECLSKMKHVWTVDRVAKSPFDDIVIPEVTISEYMWRNLDKWSDKTALVCGITDRKYTYMQLYRQTQTFGASLRKKFKIKNGDVVVVMLPNLPEFPTVTLGVLTAGGVVTTINPLYTVYETHRQISTSEAKLIVTDSRNVPVVKEALKLSKLNIPIITIDVDKERPEGTVSFKELINDNNLDLDVLKEVKRSSQDAALLLYSSGTTGLPKAVELTNRNVIANAEQQNEERIKKCNETTKTNQDTVLALLPMFHSYGLSIVTLHNLSLGVKLVTLPKFHPKTCVNTFEKHNFNTLFMAPPTVLFLASAPQLTSKHFEKLQYALVGAAPLPQVDVERFLNKVDHDMQFSQGYGLTEVVSLATIAMNGLKDYASVGYALPSSELRVVDSQLNNLGPNETGELLIRGPNVMKGYKNNPVANSQAFVDDWLKSGDMAKIDERGCVTIVGRIKEVIKVNGYQVPPAEIENIIREHPAVFDAGVVGIPDDNTGEKPKAFVVLNKEFSASKADIMEYVYDRVAPYKRLKEVHFIDTIPKNPSGKILRRMLA